MLKAAEAREYSAWVRARFIAHTTYLCTPAFGKGVTKERDARRFYPLPGDKPDDQPLVADRQPTTDEVESLRVIFREQRK